MHAVLRRVNAAPLAVAHRLLHENLVLDLDAAQVVVERQSGHAMMLDLTRTEFSLLALMMGSPTRTFSRAELLEHCQPDSNAMERVVDVHVYNLRRKLEQAGIGGVLLTVRGLGYRFRNTV